ncbi:MAG: hypothetical protein QOD65_2434 [Gaiellales bacterium]|nr:hypothetical protein [Gaiellales bacterium]
MSCGRPPSSAGSTAPITRHRRPPRAGRAPHHHRHLVPAAASRRSTRKRPATRCSCAQQASAPPISAQMGPGFRRDRRRESRGPSGRFSYAGNRPRFTAKFERQGSTTSAWAACVRNRRPERCDRPVGGHTRRGRGWRARRRVAERLGALGLACAASREIRHGCRWQAFGECAGESRARGWAPEQEALTADAAEAMQSLELLGGLDALGDDI